MTPEHRQAFKELSLFTGGGGGVWGSKISGHRIVGYVEKEKYCQQVIRARIRDGIFDDAPIFDDVRTFDGRPYRGRVDIVTAGFPCQPFSTAGKRLGAADERNMWPDTLRIIGEVQPRWAFLENVPGLIRSGYFETILQGLANAGYDARWEVISAAEVGAPHLRKRLWIVADANYGSEHAKPVNAEVEKSSQPLAHSRCKLRQAGRPASGEIKPRENLHDQRCGAERVREWPSESGLGRVAHGVAHRGDRLKALGNGQVPRVVATAWRRLTEEE